jgi:hypothetical protein
MIHVIKEFFCILDKPWNILSLSETSIYKSGLGTSCPFHAQQKENYVSNEYFFRFSLFIFLFWDCDLYWYFEQINLRY